MRYLTITAHGSGVAATCSVVMPVEAASVASPLLVAVMVCGA